MVSGAAALLLPFACTSSDTDADSGLQGSGGAVVEGSSVGGAGAFANGAGGLATGGIGASVGGSIISAGGALTNAGGAPLGAGGAMAGGAPAGTGGSSTGGADTAGGGTGGTTEPTGGLVPGTQHYNCEPPSGELPELQLTPYVTSGLDLPIYITHAPGEVDRMFVLEQAGKIQIVKNGVVNAAPFLDLTANVSIDPWEQGLLGLAFHPNYAQNGLFYVHYNSAGVSGQPDQANIIAEYKVSEENPDVADATSARVVLALDTDRNGQYLGYHNGGSIFLGLDGELFIALGDGAGRGPGEASSNSQDVTSLRGTLSRINPEASGGQQYSIPAGNMAATIPTVGGAAVAPEIWSYGLRNPYRTNMDACTGDIYFGDVGHFDYEEVDVEPARSGHHNYGWPIYEGDTCLLDANCQAPERYRAPVVAYSHNGGSGAVIGGSVYRGSAIPALRGTYIYSDLYGGTRALRYDGTTDSITMVGNNGSLEEQTNAAQQQQTLVAIQNGGDGELYFVGRGGSTEPNGPTVAQSVIYKLEVYVP